VSAKAWLDSGAHITKPKADQDEGSGLYDWVWVGDRLMFVVGYTPGGAPYGCYADELDELDPY
jgi:hypothetical protein